MTGLDTAPPVVISDSPGTAAMELIRLVDGRVNSWLFAIGVMEMLLWLLSLDRAFPVTTTSCASMADSLMTKSAVVVCLRSTVRVIAMYPT